MPYTPPVANQPVSVYTVAALSATNFALSVYVPGPVFPVVADVRTGTAYGVDNELTGTMSAGGGGSGMSKSRVVNQ